MKRKKTIHTQKIGYLVVINWKQASQVQSPSAGTGNKRAIQWDCEISSLSKVLVI